VWEQTASVQCSVSVFSPEPTLNVMRKSTREKVCQFLGGKIGSSSFGSDVYPVNRTVSLGHEREPAAAQARSRPEEWG